ncbi:MAG: hypothetical protein HOH05_09655, partial [Marinovum sp.]|nr:hypothetical protein [Marinovum sp.]
MSDTPFYTVTLSDIAFRYETQLAAFFDGSSDAAKAFNDDPTSITSGGVIWGNSTDGVILDSSINYTASIDQLLDAIENGLETEQFRSFSIYDSGNKIFELAGSATDWSITSDDMIINLSGDLPTNMSDFVEFAENLSKIPDFIGYQENWNYDWQLGGWNIDRTTLYDLPVTERNEVIYELRPYNIDRLTIRKDQEVDIWLLSGSGEPDQHLGKFTPNLELDYSYILADDLEIAAEIQYITLGRKDFGDLINTSGISLLFEDELSAFSDGSSAAAKSLTYEPTSITSNGVVWGTSSNGVILDSAINYSSSIEVLSNAINDGLETGQFRSLSIRDAGNTIFELSGSATEWSVKSGDVGFVISGNLPTSMSGLLDFVGYMSKIPDFLGIEYGSVWDEQTQQWIYTKTTPLDLSISERNDVIDGLRPYDIDRFEILPGDDFSAILTSEAGTNLDIRTFFPEIAFDFSYIDLAQSLEILAETQYIELGQKDLGDLISFSDISFRYENELSEFFEGTSPAAIAFGYQPTSITSNGVIWGSSTNGVFLDSSITNISTLDELTSSIENGLETGQFRSLSVYDEGQTIFELSGSATEWSIASDDTSLKISGDLPTSMSGLLDFLGNLSKIPDFLGIESGSVWDEQTQQRIYTKTTPLGLSISERNDVIDGLRPYDIDRLQILKDEAVSVSIVSESGLINEDIGSFTPELELDFSFISLAETLERLSEIQNANLSEREFIEISFESDQTNNNATDDTSPTIDGGTADLGDVNDDETPSAFSVDATSVIGKWIVDHSHGAVQIAKGGTDFTFTAADNQTATVPVADVATLQISEKTISGEAAALDGLAVVGSGSVAVTKLEDAASSDFSGVSVVGDRTISVTNNLNFTGDFGSGFTINVEEASTLTIDALKANTQTITGGGSVAVNNLQSLPTVDLSNISTNFVSAALGGADDVVFSATAKLGKTALSIDNGAWRCVFSLGVDFGTSTVSVSAGSTVVLTVGQAEALSANGTITGAAAGGGEPAANVYVNTGDVLSSTSATNATATVKFDLEGGTLTFDLPEDGNDVLTLSADSAIDLGGGTLVVDSGDLDVINLANSDQFAGIDNVIVNSGLTLSANQLTELTADGGLNVETTGSGSLVVEVTSEADIAEVQAAMSNLQTTTELPAIGVEASEEVKSGSDAAKAALDTALADAASDIATAAGVSVSVTKTDGGVILVAPSLKISDADDASGLLRVDGQGSDALPSFVVSLPNDPAPASDAVITIKNSAGNPVANA